MLEGMSHNFNDTDDYLMDFNDGWGSSNDENPLGDTISANIDEYSYLLTASTETMNGDVQEDSFDVTPYFFIPLFGEMDEEGRGIELERISTVFHAAVKKNRVDFISAHIPSLVRLCFEAPFLDIREAVEHLLNNIKVNLVEMGIRIPQPIPPSRFFPPDTFVPISTTESPNEGLFQETFVLFNGRVNHFDRLLAWHPEYYGRYLEMIKVLMRSHGPLPLDWRNYIAIMSVSRYNCTYLYELQRHEFLLNGGDKAWLEGIEKAPVKLQKLSKINAFLAHMPWKVTTEHIEELVTGTESWSLAELVHAFVIMSTYRSIAGLVFGLGVNPEVDLISGKEQAAEYAHVPTNQHGMDQKTNTLLHKLRNESVWKEEASTVSEFVESGGEISMQQKISKTVGENIDPYDPHDLIHKFGSYMPGMQYENFDVREDKIFYHHSFSWNEHGFAIINRYYNGIASLIDREFSTIRELSYGKFSGQQVDTTPFRRAIWYYCHRIYGILHDDYTYSHINSALNVEIKSSIKKIVCTPQTLTREDLNLGIRLDDTEKAHIFLLAANARRQMELLYALHAITEYQL